MPNDEKNQNTPSIWAWKNTAHITKVGIEGTVAVASLATAITTIFIATGAIAGPAFLASVANPFGIVALFVAAVYFTAAAYSSYQQMHKNEEISGAVTKAEGAQEAAKVGAEEAAKKAENGAVGTVLNYLSIPANVATFKGKLGIA
ncbi:MAG: hypothetical protein PG978_000249 [Wolbachia endosymbiont of Ctenocephalides felis wCfeF]|nr:MAG: hypothetical protein PG978_000249 [Wolbachia endosymbiont of Ctenocephalides felis wCfeF]